MLKQRVWKGANMGQPEAPLKAVGKAIGDEQLKSFDYMFTGLLTFSLMSMGIFGLSNQIPAEKKTWSISSVTLDTIYFWSANHLHGNSLYDDFLA